MRGFFKATALLSSSLTSAFVLPDIAALDVRSSDPIVEHASSEASLKFIINTADPAWGYPVLTFEVESTDEPCGESNVKLNDQPLETRWVGQRGDGNGFLDAYDAGFSFAISCLSDHMGSEIEKNYNKENGIHVLSLRFSNGQARPRTPGFTISYKQTGRPSILHFQPSYIDVSSDDGRKQQWGTLSTADAPSSSEKTSFDSTMMETLHSEQEQKSLTSHITSVEVMIKDKFHKLKNAAHKAMESLHKACHVLEDKAHKALDILRKGCHKQASKVSEVNGWHHNIPTISKQGEALQASKVPKIESVPSVPGIPSISSDQLLKAVQADSKDVSDNTATPVKYLPAAETRSVSPSPTPTSIVSISAPHNTTPSSVVLKSFFLVLFVLSCLTWIILRFRDPRRRADRAARREERRTKRLYRRAARHQALKNWFWNLRMKYHLASSTVLRWDEKQSRISQQEEILEDVMKDDIRALCVVSHMTATAAEEGRAGFVYDSHGEQRRPRSIRSVSTLPGYEAEGSQPPPYEPRGSGMSEEFTPDSSVVSTSPRISRDGTNSDFEEKIEGLDLNEREVEKRLF